MSKILNEISEFLQQGRSPKVKELVSQAVAEGIPVKDVLESGLLSGMSIIGKKFKNNEVFVPEVLVAARAMNAGLEILKPLLVEANIEKKGTVVIGTVKGDMHDIGKNLVRMMLEGKGLEVIDLGVNVHPESFVQKAVESGASVICCSALLTTTMNEMKEIITKLEEGGFRETLKVMVGGAPVTQHFCDMIGADGYAPDAASAADMALSYCQ